MKKKEGIVSKIFNFADEHKREIELGGEIALTLITGVLAFRAGMKAKDVIEKKKIEIECLEEEFDELTDAEGKEEEFKKKKNEIIIDGVKECALPVIAPVATCAGSVVCACLGYKDANKIIASISAAYTFAQSELIDYKEKLPEVLGDKKASELKGEVAKEKIKDAPLSDGKVIITGHGDYLCYDTYSGRYFRSNYETIRQKVNDLNEQLMDEYYVSLNEFYYMLNLPNIKLGYDLGFCIDSGKLVVDYSSILTDTNEPVLVINYDVSPKYSANKRLSE